MKKIVLILVAGVLLGCGSYKTEREVKNIKVFARVYGLVRWFYPADEAQQVDWNGLAAYGVLEVADCRNAEELGAKLRTIFEPFTNGVVISNNPKYDISLITPADTTGMKLVSWQHYGVDLGIWSNIYVSKRTNRPLHSQNTSRLAISGTIPVSYFPNGNLTISVKLKNNSIASGLKLFFRAAINPNTPENYINFCAAEPDLKPLANHGEWQTYSLSVKIDDNNRSQTLRLGIYTDGEGSFSAEDIKVNGKKLEYSEQLNPITYDYKMYGAWREISTKRLLFEERSNFGDIFSLKLADNLYVHVPLALYGTKEQTFPIGNTVTQHDAQPSDKTLMLADIIVAWNVIKYFSPYLADMGVDWDDELSTALKRALEYDGYNSRPLKLMMAQLCDAHVYVNTPYDTPTEVWNYIPMYIRKVDGKLVVICPFSSQLQRGDIIERINGENAAESFRYFEDMVSGREQFKALMAVIPWLRSFEGDVKLKIKRGSETLNLAIPLMPRSEFGEHITSMMEQNPSRWLDENTLYLNLANTGFEDIRHLLATRPTEQKVIVDIRKGTTFLLADILNLLFDGQQLIPQNREISYLPHTIYPQTPIISDTLSDITPPAPNKKIIFLVGAINISNHEEVLDYLRYAGLGYLVGTNTGGCNGHINRIELPSGGEIWFTGMKVMSNLGQSHYYYRVGIAPDLYVEESIEDIIAGRDAALEAAVNL